MKTLKAELKQILIRVRNGGLITPAIYRIEELFSAEKAKVVEECCKGCKDMLLSKYE